MGAQASSGPRSVRGWAATVEQWQGGLFQKIFVLGIYGFEYQPCQNQKLNIFRRIGNRGQMLYSNNFNLRQISENIQKNPCCQQGRVKIERAPLQWREFEEEFQRTPTLRWRGDKDEQAAWISNCHPKDAVARLLPCHLLPDTGEAGVALDLRW